MGFKPSEDRQLWCWTMSCFSVQCSPSVGSLTPPGSNVLLMGCRTPVFANQCRTFNNKLGKTVDSPDIVIQ